MRQRSSQATLLERRRAVKIQLGENLILQLESFFFFFLSFPEAPRELRVGVHYGAHIQLSEGGIAVNDINHAPTQRVVEAFEVLLGKCIRGPGKGHELHLVSVTDSCSCRLFVYLFIYSF